MLKTGSFFVSGPVRSMIKRMLGVSIRYSQEFGMFPKMLRARDSNISSPALLLKDSMFVTELFLSFAKA